MKHNHHSELDDIKFGLGVPLLIVVTLGGFVFATVSIGKSFASGDKSLLSVAVSGIVGGFVGHLIDRIRRLEKRIEKLEKRADSTE
ncbi:hypothetical protein [Trinickia sp.]|uniref:hypothetical protein n=1 Tax=Trinickia sp. TaxID=2571163 RepID=UPI003F7DFC49